LLLLLNETFKLEIPKTCNRFIEIVYFYPTKKTDEMITADTIQLFRTDYKNYLNNFLSGDYRNHSGVARNILHTAKVVENILLLANALELSDTEKYTAETLALYHDIGRFWLLQQNQSEYGKLDHAAASLEFLKTNNTFISLDEQARTVLTEVIQSHHLPEITKKDNAVSLFFSKLLRGADKLDIWRLTTDALANKDKRTALAAEFGLSEKPIVTTSFCQNIIDGGVPNKDEIVTFSDYLVFQMSWVFDLNFRKSFQILNRMQYMRHIYDALPKHNLVFEIYRMIKIHIENKIL
jgi:hypothetical protein